MRIGELALVLLWSVVVMGVTAIPYQLARQDAGADREFAGFIWGVDDGNVYLSWVRQASEGRVLLRDQYTTKSQSPHFLNVFLLGLGRLCHLTGVTPQAAFTGARYLCGVFCLLAFYILVSEFTADRLARGASLALASLSSGLGWLVVLLGDKGALMAGLSAFPMDVADGWQAQPEAIIFSSLLLNPLFALSLGLICLIMTHAARLCCETGTRSAAWLGVLLLVLGNLHGYDIFAIHATVALWLLCSCLTGRITPGGAAGRYGIIIALSIASPIWAVYGSRADPSYAAKVTTATLSPRPFDVAVGYGMVLALAVAGAWLVANAGADKSRRLNRAALMAAVALGCAGFAAQQMGVRAELLGLATFAIPVLAAIVLVGRRDADADRWRALLPLLWAACGAAIIYLPAPFQRKMIEGLHLPLCILGGLWLGAFIRRPGGLSRPVRVAAAAAVLIATTPSSALFVNDSLAHVRANNRSLLHVLAPPVHLTSGEADGMAWLAQNTSEDDVVLSSNLTGNHIPAHAPCLVVVGHWAETLRFGDYVSLVETFYNPDAPPEARRSIVNLTGATLVWWGPQERLLQEARGQAATDPAGADHLRLVHANPEVRIYATPKRKGQPRG